MTKKQKGVLFMKHRVYIYQIAIFAGKWSNSRYLCNF